MPDNARFIFHVNPRECYGQLFTSGKRVVGQFEILQLEATKSDKIIDDLLDEYDYSRIKGVGNGFIWGF